MSDIKPVAALRISEIAAKSLYPEPFASMMEARIKRKLGDHFGIVNFGINLTELLPGGMSALKHHHSKQDEFIYILSGSPTLVFGRKRYVMKPGDCFGFKKGEGIGHQLVNLSDDTVCYLEIGDRSLDDVVEYPDNDLSARCNHDGTWSFFHKNGKPY